MNEKVSLTGPLGYQIQTQSDKSLYKLWVEPILLLSFEYAYIHSLLISWTKWVLCPSQPAKKTKPTKEKKYHNMCHNPIFDHFILIIIILFTKKKNKKNEKDKKIIMMKKQVKWNKWRMN